MLLFFLMIQNSASVSFFYKKSDERGGNGGKQWEMGVGLKTIPFILIPPLFITKISLLF